MPIVLMSTLSRNVSLKTVVMPLDHLCSKSTRQPENRWLANFEQRAGFEPAIHGYCVAQAISSSGDKELAVKNLIDLASADWATPTRVLGVGLEPTLDDRDLGRK